MLKRDISQNRSSTKISGVFDTTWKCTDFLVNKIIKQDKLPYRVARLEDIDELLFIQDDNIILYDLEATDFNLLTAFFIKENNAYTLLLIDISHALVIYIDNENIHKAYFGSRLKQPYSRSCKIYSQIINLILFKYDNYQKNENSDTTNKLFRPLYELLFIQQG
jgi:hypothetical protein